MNLRLIYGTFVGVLAAQLAAGAEQGKSISLFNGSNLNGWVVMHGGEWAVDDGLLVGKNGTNWTTNPEKSGSWLRSEKQYGDFILELEYAINPRGNSGIFFRSAAEKNPAFTGYEMQVLADHGREPTRHTTGAIYEVVAASKNPSKPANEWNHVRIEARGEQIEITLNGEKIVDLKNDRSARGYIGLQNHDNRSVVRFRNIHITPL